jgi:hypothetical protein
MNHAWPVLLNGVLRARPFQLKMFRTGVSGDASLPSGNRSMCHYHPSWLVKGTAMAIQ